MSPSARCLLPDRFEACAKGVQIDNREFMLELFVSATRGHYLLLFVSRGQE